MIVIVTDYAINHNSLKMMLGYTHIFHKSGHCSF